MCGVIVYIYTTVYMYIVYMYFIALYCMEYYITTEFPGFTFVLFDQHSYRQRLFVLTLSSVTQMKMGSHLRLVPLTASFSCLMSVVESTIQNKVINVFEFS